MKTALAHIMVVCLAAFLLLSSAATAITVLVYLFRGFFGWLL